MHEVVRERNAVPSKRSLPSLTGWRFAAAMAVVVNHLADSFTPAWPTYVDDLVQGAGREGVTFFFVLSGFILTWSWSVRDGTGAFYRRRIARIVPAYLVAWVLGLLLIFLAGSRPRILEVVFGTVLLQAWHPQPSIHFGGNSVSWSLSVEMAFYALYPLLLIPLVRVGRRGRMVLLVGVFLAATVWAGINATRGNGSASWPVAVLPVARLPSFLAGVLMGLHLRDGGRVPMGTGPALVVVVLATLAGPLLPGAFVPEALVLLPFALLVLAMAGQDLEGRSGIMTRPIAIRLGQWSFALYLVHLLVIQAVELVVDLGELSVLVAVPTALALIAAGVAASGLLYTLVERPAERRLRDIGRTRPTPARPGDSPAPT